MRSLQWFLKRGSPYADSLLSTSQPSIPVGRCCPQDDQLLIGQLLQEGTRLGLFVSRFDGAMGRIGRILIYSFSIFSKTGASVMDRGQGLVKGIELSTHYRGIRGLIRTFE